MSFFAVLLALIVEQLKPLRRDNLVHDALLQWVGWAGRNLDAGRSRHAWVVWIVTVVVPAAAVAVVYVLLASYSLLLALAFMVAMLWLTLGFRQFSHFFTQIRDAIERGDEQAARVHFKEWRYLAADELPRHELLRSVLEHSLLAAHRHVFGVFFWFVVLSALGLGPAGAVFYRMAEFASRYWTYTQRTTKGGPHEHLMNLSQRAFAVIDHVPARLTAFGFAVVGNFEEAINGWRRDAALWLEANEGVLLASAAGALGVQLGGGHFAGRSAAGGDSTIGDAASPFGAASRPAPSEIEAPFDDVQATGSTPGVQARSAHLDSVVGLVWRSVVLWMLLLALLTLANVLG
jgi:adenosylcobinamide-phosphate synthase